MSRMYPPHLETLPKTQQTQSIESFNKLSALAPSTQQKLQQASKSWSIFKLQPIWGLSFLSDDYRTICICEHRSLLDSLHFKAKYVSHWAWKVAGDVKHDGLLLSDTLLAPFIVLLSVCSHQTLFFCFACCQPVEAAMVAKLLAAHIFHTEHTTFK